VPSILDDAVRIRALKRHEGFVRKFADYLYPDWFMGPDRENYEDALQVGRVAITEACDKHRENGNSGSPVDSYVCDYIKARMLNLIRDEPEEDTESLDALLDEEGWEPVSHHDTEAEALANLGRAAVRQHLTQRESDALVADVSKGTPRKSADERAAQRARAKIRRTRDPQRTQA